MMWSLFANTNLFLGHDSELSHMFDLFCSYQCWVILFLALIEHYGTYIAIYLCHLDLKLGIPLKLLLTSYITQLQELNSCRHLDVIGFLNSSVRFRIPGS